ncbi:hypothetical protein H4Q32_030968 [Labeo rohita]|uniref:Uncharacterized protein n=1 Tax=Labeo rohita TaxID=84645 RepID=A0ABQ8L676_LABRO|nr:hypothetical protein H4Q32_030968 [Labeo rohita]
MILKVSFLCKSPSTLRAAVRLFFSMN